MQDRTQNKTGWCLSAWFIISLIVLNILDFATTYIAVGHMGVGEANPLLAYLMEATGTVWIILWYKIITVGGFLALPYMFMQKFWERCQRRDIQWALGVLNSFYLAVVVSNTYNIIVLLR